jgi:hypothetical protein
MVNGKWKELAQDCYRTASFDMSSVEFHVLLKDCQLGMLNRRV